MGAVISGVASPPAGVTVLESQSSRGHTRARFSPSWFVTPCGRRPFHTRNSNYTQLDSFVKTLCKRNLRLSWWRPLSLAQPVFGFMGVPLVSAATPVLGQQFRSILVAPRVVKTLFADFDIFVPFGSGSRATALFLPVNWPVGASLLAGLPPLTAWRSSSLPQFQQWRE